MTVVDTFTPSNYQALIEADKDPGSTATLLLPSFPGTAHPNEAVVAGKGGTIYLVDQSKLGGHNSAGSDRVLQEIPVPTMHGFYGSPSYSNGKVYYQASGDALRSFHLYLDPATDTVMLMQDPAPSAESIPFPGTAPTTSSNGAAGGVVWAVQVDKFKSGGPAVLHAYNARNLATKPADQAGGAVKFVTPTVANGRVFIGLTNEVDVYGLKAGGYGTS